MKAKTERNEAICRRYQTGESVITLSSCFNIGRERVRQILRRAGIFKPYVDTAYAAGEGRKEFVGINVRPETKRALKRKAAEQAQSVSKIVSDAIEEIVK